MDGGSTDGTVEILERYKGRLHYTSASDQGPAEAIRRGFAQTHGEVLAWLNADDTYEPTAVRRGVEYLVAHPEVDVVYGDGCWIDKKGARIRQFPSIPFDPSVHERDCFLCQPLSFIRSQAYRTCEIDADLPVSFDYDL